MERIRIKMCGVTRPADALVAVEAGVDALGFIFHKKSPRAIDPEQARLIIEELPPFVDTVGVFVDKKRKEVEEIVQYCHLNYAQLHGTESPKYCERLIRFAAPCQVLKAFRVSENLTAADITPYDPHVKGYLLDTFCRNIEGGTGEIFDWSMVEQLALHRPLLLAGGLNAENVFEALATLQPYGVDVNSGVEREPGIKDHALIEQFVRQVRLFEQKSR